MPVSDADIELLEAHLDGELPSAQDAILRDRLSSDQELMSELTALRADRALRIEIFESFEPDDLAIKRLVLGVRKQITKEAVHGDRMRIMRYIASAAACVLFSFSAGWLGKGHVASPFSGDQPSQVAENRNNGSSDFNGGFTGNQGVGTLVSNTLGMPSANRNPGGYQVVLTDSLGHVKAVQHFDTLQEAQEFRDDVGRWQRQQQQVPATENVMYKDQF